MRDKKESFLKVVSFFQRCSEIDSHLLASGGVKCRAMLCHLLSKVTNQLEWRPDAV